MAKVLGIGGIFFKCADIAATQAWYQRVLGIEISDFGGHSFDYGKAVEIHGKGAMTIWSPFADDTEYFAPSTHAYMINFMVDDLEGVLEKAAAEGVEEVQPRMSEVYGDFAWIMDPDGRKLELWQPKT